MTLPSAVLATLVRFGYPLVFLGVMLEDMGLPVPGETVVVFAGFLAARGHLDLLAVMGIAAIGAILGDNLGYLVGKRLGRPFLKRRGRIWLLTEERLRIAERFFDRHGDATVFMARFISGLRVIAALLAGILGMRWRRFLLFNAAGAVAWSAAIALLGYLFGASYTVLFRWLGRGGMIVLGAVLVTGSAVLLIRHSRWIRGVVARRLPAILSLRELFLLALQLSSVGLFYLIAEDVATRESAAFDRSVALFVHGLASPPLTAVMAGLTIIGSGGIIAAVVVVPSVALWWRGARRSAVALCTSGGASALVDFVLKLSFHRARPTFPWSPVLRSYSFPSGHATTSAAVYGVLAYLLAHRFPRWRLPIAVLSCGLIVGIGLSRVYLGAHWPTDVLAGFTVGGLTAFAVVYWFDRDYHLFSLLKRLVGGRQTDEVIDDAE
jgi:membrane protein DedA with SNARE-associated domain/membrane-associated phospholipid phosphatase